MKLIKLLIFTIIILFNNSLIAGDVGEGGGNSPQILSYNELRSTPDNITHYLYLRSIQNTVDIGEGGGAPLEFRNERYFRYITGLSARDCLLDCFTGTGKFEFPIRKNILKKIGKIQLKKIKVFRVGKLKINIDDIRSYYLSSKKKIYTFEDLISLELNGGKIIEVTSITNITVSLSLSPEFILEQLNEYSTVQYQEEDQTADGDGEDEGSKEDEEQ